MKLYTVGHNNHTIDRLAGLLSANAITRLVDVRSSPYSKFNPQFNRETLEASLTERGIGYSFAGDALGGRPDDPTCYTENPQQVDYRCVMQQEWFQDGIKRLLELPVGEVTAIMCSEEDPAHCHRHHLITRYLLDTHPDIEVQHIRGDGVVFRAQMISASVDEPPSEQLSLF